MDGMVRSVEDEMRRIRGEVKQRQESEEQMRQVLKEYEKTISELISDKEKSKSRFEAEREALLSERDQSVTDLRNVEDAFADVHRKYERAKTVVEGTSFAGLIHSFVREYRPQILFSTFLPPS